MLGSSNKYVDRLYQEWSQHGKIIIAVDFDDTISPWKFKSRDDLMELDKTINTLVIAKETGAYIVINTACAEDRHEEIQAYCEKIRLPIDAINKNPIDLPYGKNGKIYANIFVDDRGGINEALEILEKAMYKVRGDKSLNLIAGETANDK